MEFPHFVRIERQGRDGEAQHYVVHALEPKLAVEFTPDAGAPDQMGQGIIKRVNVPNSWAGNYSQYAKIIAQAQAFFKASRGEPVPKIETRRLQG